MDTLKNESIFAPMSTEAPSPQPKKYRSFHLSTTISITLVLFMLGLLGLILINAQKFSSYLKENIQLTLFIDEAAAETDVLSLKKKLDAVPYIKESVFISKEKAAEKLTTELDENFVEFLGFNPLYASIDVNLKADYANPDSIKWIEKKLKAENPIITEVYYQKSMVDMVNDNIQNFAFMLLIFIGLLSLVAIALINNTIRLSLYSQRFVIKGMQLVGATRAFIRRPFIVSSLAQGLISGLLANILVIVVINVANNNIPELVNLREDIDFIALVILGVFASGILISMASTQFALNRYLKSTMDDLYLR